MASSKLKDAQVSQKGVPAVGWILTLDDEARSLPSDCLPVYSFPICLPARTFVCFAFLTFPLQLKIPWGNH